MHFSVTDVELLFGQSNLYYPIQYEQYSVFSLKFTSLETRANLLLHPIVPRQKTSRASPISSYDQVWHNFHPKFGTPRILLINSGGYLACLRAVFWYLSMSPCYTQTSHMRKVITACKEVLNCWELQDPPKADLCQLIWLVLLKNSFVFNQNIIYRYMALPWEMYGTIIR